MKPAEFSFDGCESRGVALREARMAVGVEGRGERRSLGERTVNLQRAGVESRCTVTSTKRDVR